jgi:hypothetical protein
MSGKFLTKLCYFPSNISVSLPPPPPHKFYFFFKSFTMLPRSLFFLHFLPKLFHFVHDVIDDKHYEYTMKLIKSKNKITLHVYLLISLMSF